MESRPFFVQFIDDYFSECEEHLAGLRHALLRLEEEGVAGAGAGEHVRALFRALHTLKGLSGMVGFGEAERVAHTLEDWLRAHGAPGVTPGPAVLEGLFTGARLLEQCLEARRAGGELRDVDAAVAALIALPRSGPAKAPGAAAAAAPLPADRRLWEFEFVPTPELAGRGVGVEAVRARLRGFGDVRDATPHVLAAGGVMFRFRVAAAPDARPPQEWRNDGIDWRDPPAVQAQGPTMAAAGEAAAAVFGRGDGRNGGGRLSPAHVMRVDLARLDELMRLVGELVISRARLDDGLRGTAFSRPDSVAGLQDVNAAMERQLRDLREALLRVRLVQVGDLFERLRFAIREVARETGRRVTVVLDGQSTEIDKLVVERMLEPLLHLVRNAVSHGIETPAERRAAGKTEAGTIALTASTAGERIVLTVADDGRGIDVARVAASAQTHGLLPQGVALDPAAVLDVLCAPGFSTRDEPDLASGRGVGMAVVRSTIESLGGELMLDTEPGRGTRFTIELPLTLMIVDAVLIALDDQLMAVPQPALLEVLQVEAAMLTRFENNEAMRYRGGVLPVVRLRELFGYPAAESATLAVLVVGTRAQPLGLVVDRVLGLREIVVRSVADPLVAVPGIGGAAELSDGRVVLIVDAGELARARRLRASNTPPADRRRFTGGASAPQRPEDGIDAIAGQP